ncbi:PREDICTED: F-box/LRR-repeat protein At2g40920-like [Camelina sativa]|uniref:F-box/LRR-repeat protein At2g40920-like n=1 Tax=Camelina sativa TaxID=90675 RepID=A0ABM0YI59_CAMSA|nr:PREDICTED: F-box/LRR-repeat protein At2g40920-like [Camelina sativa]
MDWSLIKRERKKRRRRNEAQDIPMDVVVEILKRLPTKSLMRFKCLSKLWSSLLCSRYFSSLFLTGQTRPRPRLYICLADLYKDHKNVILSSAPDTTKPSSSYVVDRNLTIPRMGGYISQNLLGFMCYTFWRKPRICNPATRQLFTLPAVKSSIIPRGVIKKIAYYYFGHNPLNDQYKVICSIAPNLTTMPEHWVFVLTPQGGSWKKVAPTPSDFCPYTPVHRGQSVNGVIYYLALIDMYNYVLVSFDVISEELIMSQVPRMDGDELHGRFRLKNVNLIEYGGKLTVLDSTQLRDKGMVVLWILQDAGNKEWSKKTLILHPCQLQLVNNIVFHVNGTTQSGKVVLIPQDLLSPFHILCYDLQRNDMRKIEIKCIPDHWFRKKKKDRRFDVMFMDQSESVIDLDLLGDFN